MACLSERCQSDRNAERVLFFRELCTACNEKVSDHISRLPIASIGHHGPATDDASGGDRHGAVAVCGCPAGQARLRLYILGVPVLAQRHVSLGGYNEGSLEQIQRVERKKILGLHSTIPNN